jgi:transposase
MLRLKEERTIFAWREPVDMRKSFDGLIAVARSAVGEDPLSGSVFLFRNRKCDYVKLLVWDRTGYVLYAKRLERGKFKLNLEAQKQSISAQQLSFLLDGIPIGKRS